MVERKIGDKVQTGKSIITCYNNCTHNAMLEVITTLNVSIN